jgi:hypothetical protein
MYQHVYQSAVFQSGLSGYLFLKLVALQLIPASLILFKKLLSIPLLQHDW